MNNVPNITVSGTPVKWEHGAVRYLGVWLDHALKWNDHIKIKCDKVRGLMHKISGATGENWGLRPYLGKYFWETMGRTVLSYGCLGWYPAIRKASVKDKLRKVQRMGFKRMCHFRKGTPNRGLELLFGVPPMEVHIEKTAMKAYFRTEGLAPHSKQTMKTNVPTHKGHRQLIQEKIEGHSLDYLTGPMDYTTPTRLWDREFKIDTECMTKGTPGYGIPRLADPGVLVFTDGSQDKKDNSTGAGFVLTRNNEFMRDQHGMTLAFGFRLKNTNSVYQSEMWAIKKAAQMIIENVEEEGGTRGWIAQGEPLTIYSDSQATLKALNKIQVKSPLVMETIDILNNLTRKLGRQVSLRWTKGHSGILGNDGADTVANWARTLGTEESDSPPPPKTILHSEVDAAATQMWRHLWDNTLGHRQTRDWFPNGPNLKFAFDVIRLPKLICSQVVAWVTGHCYLNRHQALIDNAETEQIRRHVGNEGPDGEIIIPPADPTCSMCKFDPSQKDKEETPLHLMTECVGLSDLRREIFGTYEPEPPFNYSVHQIVSFLKEAKIPTFPMQPFLEELFPTAPSGIPDPLPQDPQDPQNPSQSLSSDPPTSTSSQTRMPPT